MFVYYCKKCKSLEMHEEKSGEFLCKNCDEKLIPLNIDLTTWNSMSNDEMLSAIKKASADSSSGNDKPQNPPKKEIREESKKTLKALKCEMCNSNDLVKTEGLFVCQNCGTKYTVEEAKRMMMDGAIDVQGTVKIDNSAFIEKYLANARRALAKDDWEEVEKYYNMVEQNSPNNMEAVFFSSFGKAMLSLTDQEFFKREQKFKVLNKSISVINDCFETTNEDKESVLRNISDAIEKMYHVTYVFNNASAAPVQASKNYTVQLMNSVRRAFLVELNQIKEVHPDLDYIDELISMNSKTVTPSACYVATAVYGSYDCPQVWTLRRYRDYDLAKTWYGRTFIHTYYAISPTIVKWFGKKTWFQKIWRRRLDHMVYNLQKKGYESTPYEDKTW